MTSPASTIDNTFAAYVWDNEPILGIIGAIDSALGSTNINDGEGQYYGIAAADGLTAYATSSTCCAATPWTGDFVASTSEFTGAITNEPLIYFWANFAPGTSDNTGAGHRTTHAGRVRGDRRVDVEAKTGCPSHDAEFWNVLRL
jgi:hypothetical protein